MPLGPASMGAREHDRDRLSRRDVVARREVRLFDIGEERAHRLRRQGNRKSPAHARLRVSEKPPGARMDRRSPALRRSASLAARPFRVNAKRALTLIKDSRRKRAAASLSLYGCTPLSTCPWKS